MALTKTPICDFGKKAKPFKLLSTDNTQISLEDIKGEKGTLIMFICNHCPYVKAVIKDIVEDCKQLEKIGIKSVAISSNDVTNYPEDSLENMVVFSKKNNFNFPYLYDENQSVALSYEAACTPDFYLFNSELNLVYRGKFDDARPRNDEPVNGKDILTATKNLVMGFPEIEGQIPSIGCNIKWKKGNEPSGFFI